MSKFFKTILATCLIIVFFYLISLREVPDKITYGVSFSKFHADELKLDWREAYLAILNDLKVRHFRFSAHWPNIEPEDDKFNFKEIDFQMQEAQKAGADVIFAVGRRLPGWPECHDPLWIESLSLEERQEELLEYIEITVNRYKGFNNLKYWQVENEPFLAGFSRTQCKELDKEFLKKEVDLVRRLDPGHPILMTDGGEFGGWFSAYRRGDIFGTTMYLYIWSPKYGKIRYPIGPRFFKFKQNIVNLVLGKKPSLVIELSSEPWLLKPIVDTALDVQFERMGIDKFQEVIEFAEKTGFQEQYLWGAEWWYWLKKNGHSKHWDMAKSLFK